MLIFLVFDKSVTNRQTDGRTDGRTDQRTDGRTDQRTDGRTNGPTDPLIEMRGRILKTNYQCDERNKCASNKAVCAANKANTGHIMRLAHVCEKAFRTDRHTLLQRCLAHLKSGSPSCLSDHAMPRHAVLFVPYPAVPRHAMP